VPVSAFARLDAARQELRVQAARFSAHVDGLVQQLFASAPQPASDVAIFALRGFRRSSRHARS
jgi:hypothetical protein